MHKRILLLFPTVQVMTFAACMDVKCKISLHKYVVRERAMQVKYVVRERAMQVKYVVRERAMQVKHVVRESHAG